MCEFFRLRGPRDVLHVVALRQLRKQLHAKIEMVESIYDQEHQKFSSELAKQAASLTPRIQVCCVWVDHLALDGDASRPRQ